MAIGTETKTSVNGNKSFSLVANDVIKIVVNGVDDADMIYTVPSGKKVDLLTRFAGELQDA